MPKKPKESGPADFHNDPLTRVTASLRTPNSRSHQSLGLGVEGLAAGSLATVGDEALDTQLLACRLACIGPLLGAALGKPALGQRGSGLGDDLAALVLDQVGLGHPEDHGASHLTLGNDAHLLGPH